RDDLAGAGAAAVHQADHWEGEVAAVALADVAGLGAVARPDRHDHAVVDEQVGNLDGLIEQAARIEAQVKDEALDADLRELAHNPLEVAVSVVREAVEADVADLVFRIDDVVPGVVGISFDADDGFVLDLAADEVELHLLAVALDDEFDLRAFFAEDLLDRVFRGHALGGNDLGRFERFAFTIDLADDRLDEVIGLHAGAIRGAVLDRRHDLQ